MPACNFSLRSKINWNKVWAILTILSMFLGYVPVVQASTPIEVGYVDFSYPSGTGGNSEPTGEKPESKLWWNDGSWWGVLWSTSGNAYHIYRLDISTQDWIDTGTAVDDRNDSRSDALWDGQRLYIVSHIFAKNAGAPAPAGQRGELYRYSYDSSTKSYSLDPGFPIEITGGVSETLVMEKDSEGTLWVTYVENSKVMVNHSISGDDLSWGTPFVLPGGGQENVSSDDISSIIAYTNHIGVMWSNQNSPREMYFAVHPVGAPDGVWTPTRTYAVSGDDHINLKSLETDDAGNVFAVIKTSRSAELIVLLVCKNNINRCKSESDWTSYPIYASGEFKPTRPILLIDTSSRELYVFTRNVDVNGDSGIYYKTMDMDNIQVPPGIGVPFIKDVQYDGVNDPTSTKQNVNDTTGLVVLASDGGPDYYLHNYLSLGPVSSPSPSPTSTATDIPTDTPAPGNTPTFTPTAVNQPTSTLTPTVTFTSSPVATSTSTPTLAPGNGTVIGEVGEVAGLKEGLQTVVFSRTYVNPVVFAQPLSRAEGDSAVVRITGVQGDRFNLYVHEAPNHDGVHVGETVGYIVLEAGSWQLEDGKRLEVGKITADATVGRQISNSWDKVSFAGAFSAVPVVISQVQTANDPSWVQTRQKNMTASGFEVAMEEEEAATSSHGSEVMGWLAMEAGVGDWDGHAYEVKYTGNVITDSWYQVGFGQQFSQAPRVIGALVSYNGKDSAHLRYDGNALTASGVAVMVEEDTTKDTEMDHTTEVMGYLAIEGNGALTANVFSQTGSFLSKFVGNIIDLFSSGQ